MKDSLKNAMESVKTNTARLGMAQAIDKGTTYGASVATLAQETIDRGASSPIIEDNRAIEDLYSANVAMRTQKQDSESIKTVIRKVQTSGGTIEDFINRMKHEKANLEHEGLSDDDKKEFEEIYEHNIKLLEEHSS